MTRSARLMSKLYSLTTSSEFWWGGHSCLPRGDVLIDPNQCRRQTGMSAPPKSAVFVTAHSRISSGSMPFDSHHCRYANGEISLGLISLRPPQKTLV
jgi:hypothetical protein